jgi:hypothetical protein
MKMLVTKLPTNTARNPSAPKTAAKIGAPK